MSFWLVGIEKLMQESFQVLLKLKAMLVVVTTL